ncbi:MAG: response regulator transcription factor [Sphingobacteriia bacterium]|jgi:two-component system, OmpR family, alkaline phosphatase synthesis response regulator PhoP|nr:response regulator transcription factor [Sphingobacteriia bacterium]
MRHNAIHILVIDDEEDLCEILQFNLEMDGYCVNVAYSAEAALKMNLASYNLILLDVMMGDISGFRMAKQLRNNPLTAKIPIIFLTARNEENDLLTGFGLGADDYITKPFSIKEVQARIKAVLKRSGQPKYSDSILSYDELHLFLDSKKVMVGTTELFLTKKEFEILKLLLENKNHVYSREELLQRVWTNEVCVLDRTIDVNITRLRHKIAPYGKNIVTRLGYGYCFDDTQNVHS